MIVKVGFFHDTYMHQGKDGNTYSTGFPYTLWQERYLQVFDELVICTRQGNQVIEEYESYRVSNGPHVFLNLNLFYKSPVQMFYCKRKITKPIAEVVAQVDACIIRMPSVMGVLAVQECIKQNKPWAVEVVACCWDSLWNYGNIKGKLLAPIMYFLNKHYIKRSKYAIYVSQEFLQRRYPCKGVTTYASDVNIKELEEDALDKRLKKIGSMNKEKNIVLGLIGSLNVEFKGHHVAIQAIRLLKDKGYKVTLRCLGAGNKERWIKVCEKLGVQKEVEFSGILPSGEPVLEWMDDIDIFVMPSLQEGLPRSMIEAMSRGCPVIGARTGGIPELIEKEFIVERKNAVQISELVIRLIQKENLMRQQAKRNFTVAKMYEKNKMNKKREEFFKEFKKSVKN